MSTHRSRTTAPSPPEPLQQTGSATIRVLRQKIWKRCNVDNEHFMAAVVGREGSGKSWTALHIAELVDPSFNAKRVMFDPETFLNRLREWKANGETQGKMVVVDEAGVGLGKRTWYDRDQVLFNQVLQVIRDENMGVLFTVPRLEDLDSQTASRMHALLEMQDKEAGEYADLKWKNITMTRDGRDKVYKKFPRMRIGGLERRVTRLRFAPPSEDLAEAYEVRKERFQAELYDDVAGEYADEEEDDAPSPSDVVEEIKAEGTVDEYLSYHGGHKSWYVDKDLIREAFDLSHNDAKTVKKLLNRDGDIVVDTERQTQG